MQLVCDPCQRAIRIHLELVVIKLCKGARVSPCHVAGCCQVHGRVGGDLVAAAQLHLQTMYPTGTSGQKPGSIENVVALRAC